MKAEPLHIVVAVLALLVVVGALWFFTVREKSNMIDDAPINTGEMMPRAQPIEGTTPATQAAPEGGTPR